jgi:hypothetical protein
MASFVYSLFSHMDAYGTYKQRLVILATREAEIRRIVFPSWPPRQITHETLPRKNPSQIRDSAVV